MGQLGALADPGVLDLDEIADLGPLAELGAWTQPRERSDGRVRPDMCALDVAEGANNRPAVDNDARPEDNVRLDRDVLRDLRVPREVNAARVLECHARLHEVVAP